VKKKILIIRFNSIGDIVLTSPVSEALNAAGYEVHYLVKSLFASLLKSNPNITKVWELKSDLNETIHELKKIEFFAVVDLHNNLRSSKVKRALSIKSYTFKKPRIKYFLLTKFGMKFKPEPHIVNRFLYVIEPLIGKVENVNTSFYFDPVKSNFDFKVLPENFMAIAVGAAFKTKMIPTHKLIQLIDESTLNVVLIGGPADCERAHKIVSKTKRKIINLVGEISISDSAKVIQNCQMLVSGDTGMMHIGAALNVPMVNVFGSTHPILGYTPFYGNSENKSVIIQNPDLSCRPCTKQGSDACPKGHFKCMNSISVDEMLNVIQ